MKSVSDASAKTIAASTSPAGVFPSSATTSTGTSMIRRTVSRLGRFRGNTRKDLISASRDRRKETQMKTRTLGPGGPEVSAIGLGCMGMSAFYGATDEAEGVRTIRRALE